MLRSAHCGIGTVVSLATRWRGRRAQRARTPTRRSGAGACRPARLTGARRSGWYAHPPGEFGDPVPLV